MPAPKKTEKTAVKEEPNAVETVAAEPVEKSAEKPDEASDTVTETASDAKTVTVTAHELYVRSEPGGTVLTVVSEGDELAVAGEEDGWVDVLIHGFVKADFVA